jgi:hypothetical protein
VRNEEFDIVRDGGRMFEGEARSAIRHIAYYALYGGAAIVIVERALEERSLPDGDFWFFGHTSHVLSCLSIFAEDNYELNFKKP